LHDLETSVDYAPDAGKQWRRLFLIFGFGAVLLLAGLLPSPASPRQSILFFVGGVALLAGFALLLAIIRGVPRLTIDRRGVLPRSPFGSKFATWSTLGAFGVTTRPVGRGRQVISASAPIIAPSGVPNPAGKLFYIPDAFGVPLTAIVADLTARHGGMANRDSPLPHVVMTAELPIGVIGFRWPWLTLSLFTTFIIVFIIEQRLALAPAGKDFSPTLIALGGLNRPLVLTGEWYRLLSAPFLHGSLVHLIANGIAFCLAGYTLERLVGWVWAFCIFAGGAVCGSAMSLALLPASMVSVGASGAIMAMLLGMIVVSVRLPAGPAKIRLMTRAGQFALPALIPLNDTAVGFHIDYSAHLGGALFGAALGFLLLRTWGNESPLPRFRGIATGVAGFAVLAFAAAAAAVTVHYPNYSIVAQLIPRAEVPTSLAEISSKSEHLLAAWPHDPRAHFFAGVARLQTGDQVGGERELRTALSLAKASEFVLEAGITNLMRVSLALAVLDQGRRQEASAIALPACGVKDTVALEAHIAAAFAKSGLCEGTIIAPVH
jgi:rhomboid protease GluP